LATVVAVAVTLPFTATTCFVAKDPVVVNQKRFLVTRALLLLKAILGEVLILD